MSIGAFRPDVRIKINITNSVHSSILKQSVIIKYTIADIKYTMQSKSYSFLHQLCLIVSFLLVFTCLMSPVHADFLAVCNRDQAASII